MNFTLESAIFSKRTDSFIYKFSHPLRLLNTSNLRFYAYEHDDKTPQELIAIEFTVHSNQLFVRMAIDIELINATVVMQKITQSLNALAPSDNIQQGDIGVEFADSLIFGVCYFSQEINHIFETTAAIGSIIIFPVVASVGTCHMVSLIYVVKFLQSFDYLALMNSEMPVNLSQFLRFFARNAYDLMPKIVEENIPKCNLDLLLTQAGLDCMIIRAIFPVMVPIFTIVCLKLALLICKYSIRNTNWIGRSVRKLNSLIGVNILIWIMLTNQVELMINFWPFVYSLGYISATNYIGDAIGVLIFLSFIILFVYFSWKAHHSRPDDNKLLRSFLGQFKTKPREAAYYFSLGVLQDLLVPPSVIFLIDSPLFQMSTLGLFALLKLCFLIALRPFKSPSNNIIEVLNNGVIGAVIGLLFMLEIFKDEISEEFKYRCIGYPCIVLIIAVICVNVGIPNTEIVFKSIHSCIKKKNRVVQEPNSEQKNIQRVEDNELEFENEIENRATIKMEFGNKKNYSAIKKMSKLPVLKQKKFPNKLSYDHSHSSLKMLPGIQNIVVKSKRHDLYIDKQEE